VCRCTAFCTLVGRGMESWALDACSLDRILLVTEHLLGAYLQGITPSLPDLSFLTALKDVRVTLLWHRRSMRIPLVTVPRTPGSPALHAVRSSPGQPVHDQLVDEMDGWFQAGSSLSSSSSCAHGVIPHARIPSLSLSRERCIIIDDPATGVGTLINKSFEATIICIVHPPRRKGDLQGQQVGSILQPERGLRCLVLTFWNRAREYFVGARWRRRRSSHRHLPA
jgi:hypothetical protein